MKRFIFLFWGLAATAVYTTRVAADVFYIPPSTELDDVDPNVRAGIRASFTDGRYFRKSDQIIIGSPIFPEAAQPPMTPKQQDCQNVCRKQITDRTESKCKSIERTVSKKNKGGGPLAYFACVRLAEGFKSNCGSACRRLVPNKVAGQ